MLVRLTIANVANFSREIGMSDLPIPGTGLCIEHCEFEVGAIDQCLYPEVEGVDATIELTLKKCATPAPTIGRN